MTYYTVYRTQNLVNGKYYFGVHKTKDPYDKYLGSGKVLKRAIAKYGKQAFIKNLCFVFDNPEEAFVKEYELIETYRADPLCYNLRQGGSGGFDWINREGISGYRKGGESSSKIIKEKWKTDPVFVATTIDALNRGRKKWHSTVEAKIVNRKNQVFATAAWKGKTHTTAVKTAQAQKMKGNTFRLGKHNRPKIGDVCVVVWGDCAWCFKPFLKHRKTNNYCSSNCAKQKVRMPDITELLNLRSNHTVRSIAAIYKVKHPTVIHWLKKIKGV